MSKELRSYAGAMVLLTTEQPLHHPRFRLSLTNKLFLKKLTSFVERRQSFLVEKYMPTIMSYMFSFSNITDLLFPFYLTISTAFLKQKNMINI